MLPPVHLDWHSPLEYLAALPETGMDYTLLYSGMRTAFSGRYSLLALHPYRVVESADFSLFRELLTTDLPAFANGWLGYMGYGLKHAVEKLPSDKPSFVDLPDLHFTLYETLLVFDHDTQSLMLYRRSENSPFPPAPLTAEGAEQVAIASLASDMSKGEYLRHVQAILEEISRGSLYQANLTRKFYGEFATRPHPARLFTTLTQVSPAPYSALLRWGDTAILSSSPEQFLQMDAQGRVETRPIKGSARRSHDAAEDAAIKQALAASEKDRAENLMIVDLMRNDLSRSCEIGSVKTQSLYDISTYATVHHMSSTIHGQRRKDISPLDLVAQCFPPGSMTGAPKIRAMELCSALEPRARGVYSGAIGWFGGDGAVDLSVVIRTLVMQGSRFEFQVGGAIVHGSTPEGEWEETLVKARGLAKALGIDEARLRAL